MIAYTHTVNILFLRQEIADRSHSAGPVRNRRFSVLATFRSALVNLSKSLLPAILAQQKRFWRVLPAHPCAGVRRMRLTHPRLAGALAEKKNIYSGNGRILFFLLISFIIFFCGINCYAETIDRYPFSSVEQQQQFQSLITQLRCLVCQNQDLADSNADLAKDLRQQVYTMVRDGKTDDEIKQYMVSRYGDFILFKPPLQAQTYLLWAMPFLLLLIGAVILWRIVKSRNFKKC